MNHKFKMRQRVTALCMAAMMCCGMLPYGALAEDSARPVVVATPEQAATQEAKSESDANSTATPETADESPDEDAPQQEPETEGDTGGSDELYEIWHKMYPSLTQEPTGYYLDSYGLPVLVGETKISIEGWGNEDYSSVSDDSFQQVALDAALLDADSTTAAFPHMDGEDYAIVPISMQVMYPANGSSADITLPDNVELLGYSFTSGDLTPATEEERQSQLHYEFSEISASVAGIYVKASEDFSVTMTYTDATQTLTKTVHVTLDDSAPVPGILQDRFAQETQVAMCSADEGIATYAGLQVTQCVNTSVGWMNYLGGQPALCGDRGKWAWGPGATYKNKYPPVANYTPAGQVWVEAEYFNKGWVPDQATLWSKGFNNGAPAVASLALDAADNATDNYLALLSWQAEQYPDSIAAEIVNAPEAYAAPTGKTVYVGTLYTPSNAAWQRFVVLNYTPVVLSGDSEIPGFETGGESVDKPWSASYERSESLDFSYTVNTDKIQLDTLEKVDGAGIEIAPILDGIPADIDGGSWTITPDGMQSVTTSGHTADDNYHLNGGDGSVTWTVHFSVSKSASQSGSITANSEQDADAQASAAQSAAQSACEGQVNGEIEAALSAAHNYFDNLKFSYNEVTVPHGFDAFGGDFGSSQPITVPANSSNDYLMKNDEWSIKVAIDKIDSETKQRIKGDAAFKIYEWDTVLQRYIPAGGYNQYAVERQPDGTYKVINHSSYANGSDNIYYTQRNEGRFVVVESRAPSGYYGDWTDVTNPGAAGSVLGKRAYAFEITKALDGQTLWLGNADYNADITTTNNGGTLIDTGEAIVTITFGDRAADKTYETDPTGIANNEKSYTMHADGDKMQNDRVLGSILLTKVDLDAARYLAASSNGDTTLEGAVYDLYAADTIAHPDGVTGTVDYSKILDANGNPIWHTTVLTNGGWDTNYLPILQKDRLVASAAIKDGKLAFSNLYMGRYYLVERATGLVLPIDGNGKLYTTGKYPQLNKKLERTGKYSDLVRKNNEYTDYLYKNQYSAVAESRKLDGSKAWDGCNYVLSDPKGELLQEYGNVLLSQGYKVKVFNLKDRDKSDHYNLFAYIKNEDDILVVTKNLVKNLKEDPTAKSTADPIWEEGMTALLEALIGYVFYELEPEERNMNSVMTLLLMLESQGDGPNSVSQLDLLFDDLSINKPDSFAAKQYKLYKMAPGKTAQSINVSLGLRMSAFNIPSIANICADDTIDLRELGSEKKVALFVVTPDTTTAYNFLAAVMFQQCFQILVDIADHRPDKRLPRHLRFLLDEFPNIGMIPDFQILISTIRSRDIACTLIYQSLNQLKSQYKDDWATIYENCDSMIVLGAGGNPENLEFFSKALGKATIEVMNTSENKGSQGSYTKSYQALGRELMTPEEIRTMPRNWCLLMISGVAPFYSRKYNLKDHPNYHLVEAEGGKPFDYDRRAEQSFADFISNVKDVKTVNLCAENNN